MDKTRLASLEQELVDVLGSENVTSNPVERFAYGFESSFHFSPPAIVARPRNRDDVVNIVTIAARNEIPLTARGAGTSLSAQSLSLHDGILVDFRQMNKIKAINIGDQQVIIEPGVYYRELNKKLEEAGFFFPPEPGSSDFITIGGMVGNNASGMHAVKYGATKNWVIDLEVVLANGQVMHTGSKSLKSSSGYCLNELFVGSEGTLGLITEVTLKIAPAPKCKETFIAVFPSIEAAGECAVAVLKSGIVPSAMEFCDDLSMGMMKDAMKVDLPPVAYEPGKAALFIEVDGATAAGVDAEGRIIMALLQEMAIEVREARTEQESADLWHARHALLTILSKVREGRYMMSQIMDIGIPTSKIPSVLKEIKELLAQPEYFLSIAIYGHIGDGNVHFASMVNPNLALEVEKGIKVRDKIVDIILAANGTLSAEHGTGWARTLRLADELGYKLEAMKQIKQALDPGNIMNPGAFFEVPVDETGRPSEFVKLDPYMPGGDGA
ncbi:MAG TPA: FAD-binding oxidoreductase [Candidatus Lokiarchaeia archaeon]|nr:FAD-binding oxidoreductase [Candidatus Lokiarchaeia archaeon]